MSGFGPPRLFAALSVACLVVAALSVADVLDYGWRTVAGLLLAAGAALWLSHAMCEAIRDERRRDHRAKRWASSPWTTVRVQPPRVSSSADVSLLARILATPDER